MCRYVSNELSFEILNFSVEQRQTKGKVIFIVPGGIIHESPCEEDYPVVCRCSVIFINFNWNLFLPALMWEKLGSLHRSTCFIH